LSVMKCILRIPNSGLGVSDLSEMHRCSASVLVQPLDEVFEVDV
jgi:hypothetical protein